MNCASTVNVFVRSVHCLVFVGSGSKVSFSTSSSEGGENKLTGLAPIVSAIAALVTL